MRHAQLVFLLRKAKRDLKSGKEIDEKELEILLRYRSRVKHIVGTHGSAKFQRKHLKTTGTRHESEHVIGYNVYAQDSDRNKGGEGKQLELTGLAYLEVAQLHKKHPGTGSGDRADDYRENQRLILEEGKLGQADSVSLAVQYNQLEYSFLNEDQSFDNERDLTIARISYEAMVRNGNSVTYVNGEQRCSFQITQIERAEMLLAYAIRKNRTWPTQAEIAKVVESCGLDVIRTGNTTKSGESVVLAKEKKD